MISSLLFILLSFNFSTFAQEELASFCFNPPVNLSQVKEEVSFLLLPVEKVFLRSPDNCIDIATSSNRVKLLEKFLSKRYSLTEEPEMKAIAERMSNQHCRLELKTTRLKKTNGTQFIIGQNSNAAASASNASEISTSELLLGLGKPGLLEIGARSLMVECRRGASGIYQLIFSFSEQSRAKVNTEISVKKDETVNIAQIENELDQKNKTLGIPQISYKEDAGKEQISYELKVKD